ncbi:hypothetical protein EYF80_007713 [Liparis tanakae]|uniref:Secreted protein n=1 Tax=Liparis tanakae TaxID=230148 RepID=A0A4Z2IWD4_9TELE|nr:hypothetical protein EYF80_007713 [Liparis tanakae]
MWTLSWTFGFTLASCMGSGPEYFFTSRTASEGGEDRSMKGSPAIRSAVTGDRRSGLGTFWNFCLVKA